MLKAFLTENGAAIKAGLRASAFSGFGFTTSGVARSSPSWNVISCPAAE